MSDDELIQAYVRRKTNAGQSPRTLVVRQSQLRLWRAHLEATGVPGLAQATAGDVDAWLATYPNRNTRHGYQSALAAFYGWANRTGLLAVDPTLPLDAVRRPEGEPNPIPDDQLAAFLVGCDPIDRTIVTLGRYAGMRAAEIAAANKSDLVRVDGRWRVRILGKGEKLRYVPAHMGVRRLLANVTDPGGWVLPSPVSHREHWAEGSVSARMSDRLPENWTCHTLRHAFACDAYALTKDIRKVQQWLGHDDLKTTARYVLPFDDSDLDGLGAGLGTAA